MDIGACPGDHAIDIFGVSQIPSQLRLYAAIIQIRQLKAQAQAVPDIERTDRPVAELGAGFTMTDMGGLQRLLRGEVGVEAREMGQGRGVCLPTLRAEQLRGELGLGLAEHGQAAVQQPQGYGRQDDASERQCEDVYPHVRVFSPVVVAMRRRRLSNHEYPPRALPGR